MIGKSGVRCK
ncbi:hypothetical protein SAMN05660830_00409 [Halodesulfovibrio aestuarii]|uniref:Uncharacterized protein n=1 Tax=Halodesulfovibrio aestuarii TaxID=126333 RepID=A0A8G2C791_9BACT|nr:hypothetical protein SAMN05660830_00409 [Halodesulfovibrio aestuarii]